MRHWLIFLALALLSSCTLKIDGNRYVETAPKLDLLTFFNGNVKAWGIVQDRSGNVISRFTVDIQGQLQNGILILDETFEYGVGSGVEKRIWTIQPQAGNQLTGSATDIPGPAKGEQYGNALFWGYAMTLPVGESSYRVKFEDWMWAFDDNTLVNRSYIKKFGITFAEVTIFMQRQ